jgi:Ca2+-binding EF-hand superfamily protein
MRQSLIVALAALMLVGCGQANVPSAAVNAGQRAEALKSKAKTPKALMKQYDADKNGAVSRDEFLAQQLLVADLVVANAEEDLQKARVKGDEPGKKSRISAAEAMLAHAKATREKERQYKLELFAVLDADDSGALELNELTLEVVKGLG